MLGRDLAIDLGSTSTRIYQRGRGVVLDQPSVVAVEAGTGRLVAAGADAREMVGRTPQHLRAARPVRGGVVTDADDAERMLRFFVDEIRSSTLVRPRVVVAAPSHCTAVERRALEEVALGAGARRVFVLEEVMAAAIGAGVAVDSPRGTLVVDAGGGTTDAAVISLGGVVVARGVRRGGDAVDEAVARHLREGYGVLVGERTAEDVKIAAASAFPYRDEGPCRVAGRDLSTGLPRAVSVPAADLRRAADAPVRELVELVREVLDICPPELVGDVVGQGVVLTGAATSLRGLAPRLQHELGVPVRQAEEPGRCVIHGAGRCVEEFSALERLVGSGSR